MTPERRRELLATTPLGRWAAVEFWDEKNVKRNKGRFAKKDGGDEGGGDPAGGGSPASPAETGTGRYPNLAATPAMRTAEAARGLLRDGVSDAELKTFRPTLEKLSKAGVEQVAKSLGHMPLKTKKATVEHLIGKLREASPASGSGPAPGPTTAGRFGETGENHPLGKTSDEQASSLLDHSAYGIDIAKPPPGYDAADPLGYRKAGFPAGHDREKFAGSVQSALRESPHGQLEFHELYNRAGKAHGMSKKDFAQAVTSLGDGGETRLAGSGRSLVHMPEPALASVIDGHILYTAKLPANDPVGGAIQQRIARAAAREAKTVRDTADELFDPANAPAWEAAAPGLTGLADAHKTLAAKVGPERAAAVAADAAARLAEHPEVAALADHGPAGKLAAALPVVAAASLALGDEAAAPLPKAVPVKPPAETDHQIGVRVLRESVKSAAQAIAGAAKKAGQAVGGAAKKTARAVGKVTGVVAEATIDHLTNPWMLPLNIMYVYPALGKLAGALLEAAFADDGTDDEQAAADLAARFVSLYCRPVAAALAARKAAGKTAPGKAALGKTARKAAR